MLDLLLALEDGSPIRNMTAVAEYGSITCSAVKKHPKNENEPLEFGEFMELSNIVVNPSDSEGRRLLMVSLGLETDEARHLGIRHRAREMVVRDTVIKDTRVIVPVDRT